MNEIWKPVAGYEGVYEASNLGRVRSLSRTIRCGHGKYRRMAGRVLVQSMQNAGYLTVHLARGGRVEHRTVHRIVAGLFCERRSGCDVVNHIDANRLNNSASNLEWCTSYDNYHHARDIGVVKIPRGSAKGAAKLTETDIPQIRYLIARGWMIKDIASMYGVASAQVSFIKSGRAWSHVP